MTKRIQRIQKEPLKDWITKEVIFPLTTEQCDEFNSYISKEYPWQGYIQDRIEWEEVEKYTQFDWSNDDDEETKKFIKTTCVAKYQFLAVVFSALEPGVVGSFDFIVDNLEKLNNFSGISKIFFIVGATKNNYGLFELCHEDFFEVSSIKLLIRAPI